MLAMQKNHVTKNTTNKIAVKVPTNKMSYCSLGLNENDEYLVRWKKKLKVLNNYRYTNNMEIIYVKGSSILK